MAIMVLVPWLLVKIFRLENFIPLPMAQIAFGICFGPSALGYVFPDLWENIFTIQLRNGLDAIQILAITIFAFIAGNELKPKEILQREGSIIWIQTFQIILVPIILATICFYLFFNDIKWYNSSVPFWKYAWSMGVATCITAMPMLVISCKILGIWETHTSKKLLGLVTFDDLILWLTVAFIVSLGKYYFKTIIFFVLVIFLYNNWSRFLSVTDEKSYPTLTVCLTLVMASLGYWAGLHYVLGAFLAGMITPKNAIKWNKGMEDQQMFWLMPVFFIWTGLKSNWSLDFINIFMGSIAMFLIAIVTKFIGVYFAYYKKGIRLVLFYTALLQTKGLMEIFLVSLLLSAEIITNDMFAAVVIMSLISTVLAVPLAKLFYKKELLEK